MKHLVLLALLASLACSKTKPDADKPAGLPATPQSAPAPAAAPTPPPPAADDQSVTAPDPRATIGGTITLPAARKKDVAPTDIVFIIARRSGGPPGPGSMLATQKHPVGAFPMPFTLSSRDAMVPGNAFAGPVDITVRLDKDGDALTRKKGDLYGQVKGVNVGTQDVMVPLDTIQAEDQTLSGGRAAAPPRPGLPPGHP